MQYLPLHHLLLSHLPLPLYHLFMQHLLLFLQLSVQTMISDDEDERGELEPLHLDEVHSLGWLNFWISSITLMHADSL
jgi:hypothetical protein